MWVTVRSTPGTLEMWPGTSSAIASWSATRVIATRSTSPAQE